MKIFTENVPYIWRYSSGNRANSKRKSLFQKFLVNLFIKLKRSGLSYCIRNCLKLIMEKIDESSS